MNTNGKHAAFGREKWLMILAGVIVGAVAIILMSQGNPKNMGFCIACFLRDSAGALKLHQAPPVQYLRPEIIGLILGSFIFSLVRKEFNPRGGSSPVQRFIIGFAIMVGALVFLGCPLRMVLRMSAGDLNAWVGLIGFVCGIYVGSLFLKKGFTLRPTHSLGVSEGIAMPAIQLVMLCLLLGGSTLLVFSEKGPGSMHAPIWLSLVLSLVVGATVQRSRLCQMGGIRDVILLKDSTLLIGSIAMLITAMVGNLIVGNMNWSFAGQPIAHSEFIWNILGLFVVGFGSTLIGGCPLRQLVLSGTGNGDSAIAVLGMIVGAAFCHNFSLASSGEGTTPNGRIACIAAIVVLFVIAALNLRRKEA